MKVKVLTANKSGSVVIPKVELADRYFTRLRGLMYRKVLPANSGLLIVPCNSIHTFGMKFAIDTVYLDRNNVVVRVDKAVLPHRVCKSAKSANKVLELNGGAAASFGIRVGDKLDFNPNHK